MKTCLATVVTSQYIPYAQVMLKSLQEHGDIPGIPMYIFHVDTIDHSFHTIENNKMDLNLFYDDLILRFSIK